MKLLSGMLAVLISAGITFPQLVLTYELALRSNRATPAEGFAYVGSFSPFAFICLLFPSLESFFISKLYLGVIPLFFMMVSFFLYRQSKIKAVYWLVLFPSSLL